MAEDGFEVLAPAPQVRITAKQHCCGVSSPSSSTLHALGEIDASFCKGRSPAWLELLVRVPKALDAVQLLKALEAVLPFYAAGRRDGSHIVASDSVRVGIAQASEATILMHPVPSCLFEPPRADARGRFEVLTLRIATASSWTALGLTWDHALCDVGGASLLLSRLSAVYTGAEPLPPPLDHARDEQRSLVVTAERGERVSPSSAAAAAAPPPNAEAVASGAGGVGTLYWRMSAAQLHRLKTAASAQTRHDALWAEVIRLLRGAGHAVRTASISRDGRRRSPTMSPYHFGNATCIVFAALPSPPSEAAAVAAAVRAAIEGEEAVAQLRRPADVHFTSWWHPLQAPMTFGASSATDFSLPSTPSLALHSTQDSAPRPSGEAPFAIGPTTLAIGCRICARSRSPNVTVVPDGGGGLGVYLTAPLPLVHAVRQQLAHGRPQTSPRLPLVTPPLSLPPPTTTTATPPPPPPPPPPTTTTTTTAAVQPAPPTPSTPPTPGTGRSVSSLPCGHTLFSWKGAHTDAVPLGHTPFSWRSSRRSWVWDGDTTPTGTPTDAEARGAPKAVARAAVVWLHGVGDTGAGWEGKWHNVSQQRPGLEFHHPTAPNGPVAARGGQRLTRWFHLHTWPVTLEEPDPPASLDAAVKTVHDLLETIILSGVPSEHVLLGGFSQGGAAALEAGLRFPSRLAGLCSISGWLACRANATEQLHACNRQVPIFFSYGTADPIVSFQLARASGSALASLGGREREGAECTCVMQVDRAAHAPKQKELVAAGAFMLRCLPHTATSASAGPFSP